MSDFFFSSFRCLRPCLQSCSHVGSRHTRGHKDLYYSMLSSWFHGVLSGAVFPDQELFGTADRSPIPRSYNSLHRRSSKTGTTLKRVWFWGIISSALAKRYSLMVEAIRMSVGSIKRLPSHRPSSAGRSRSLGFVSDYKTACLTKDEPKRARGARLKTGDVKVVA